MGHSLLSGVIGDFRRTASFAGSCDCGRDGVSCLDGDTTCKVVGVIWIPFIPSVVCDRRTGLGPVDAGLQDCASAGVTINSDPRLDKYQHELHIFTLNHMTLGGFSGAI